MQDLYLLVTIGGRPAALPGVQVQSVVDLGAIVPVHRAPPHVRGLAALRSRALTVIDTRVALGLSACAMGTETRAAVVEISGHGYALLMDSVDDVALALRPPAPPEASLGPGWDQAASAVIDTASGPAVVLDIAALVNGAAGQATCAA